MSFATLAEIGMPPILMDIGRYSSVPEWPTAGEVYPALAIQVNFVKDGLILCFAFHHAVADGGAFTEFVKEFGSGTTDPGNMSPVAPRIGYIAAPADQILPLTSFPEYDSRRAPTRAASTGEATTTTAIFQFSAETVRQLEGAVAAQLKKTIGPDAWASNIACLSSLVWVAVVRARQARLAASDTAKIGIAVNARSVLRLPDDYFGNCIVHTNATASVEELLSADTSANIEGSPSIISIAAVAHAAWKMRQAVKGVNSKYVNDRLTTFSALEDPGEVSRAYEAATDNANTGIDFSSWRDQGADVEFGIPGTCTSKVDVWRKGWSPNEGAYNILPRKGGSKGEACWEVSLGLSKEDMERVVVCEELGSWTTRWVGESLGWFVKGSQPCMEE
ncbi:transferase family-domain-containing protein [Neohortaea acidophila]|uniref:Transferase family-domain-containing protein n=1 Tax=Neohortaea acidophila TaxID=245834 RepID=A0A6A6PI54_9PEZI|nr:transferase family-domain-containing protein [Neohortaea acidophila]KAF2479689.1 transferase family-domain-containing protein [Neohortaea acidophila]